MISTTVKYKLYPSLLSCFDRFERGYLDEQGLLDRINRVPVPQTEAQFRGASFEDAVIKGIGEESFDPEILSKVRSFLPRPMLKTQVYCEYQLNDSLIYGYVDVIGKMLAVDIKTTGNYRTGCFAQSHQNFYLPALRAKGIRSLRYVITDFKDVYLEEYDQMVDLNYQEGQVLRFCEFLEAQRERVTDLRVFARI
ncbi:hypothetical protein [Dyadobacter fermentans]|uniref:PD-(D/E)XK endonuclease-like domain-containing protein n=1 Tax=Dyadobacter fermentans (strain ATCC 700827 / DSM 18053 / CIP 107007 / KCTC 52180 / NS114) TaxID=471854 RepID=C6VZ19_DYAFD|nr:hypothetical protein [Dyadobacter fermentans]ACT95225.1 hypothetical protein Dfer_4021 [Dyadobacter fermentans DSM 18053]